MVNPDIFVPLTVVCPGDIVPCSWIEIDAVATVGPEDIASYVWGDDGYLSSAILIAPDYTDGVWTVETRPDSLTVNVWLANPGPYGGSDYATLKVYANIPGEYGQFDGVLIGEVALGPLANEAWVEVVVPLDWQNAAPEEGIGKIALESYIYSGSPTIYIAPECP